MIFFEKPGRTFAEATSPLPGVDVFAIPQILDGRDKSRTKKARLPFPDGPRQFRPELN